MSLEIRKTPIHSIKEFTREFFMIVVSIITALGLEQAVSTLHHRHAAEQSRRKILQEIKTNLAETRAINRENAEQAKVLAGAIKALLKDLKARTPVVAINESFLARYHGMPVGLRLPTLRHEAWDVAVANQAATYIDEVSLRRYSAAYASQRDIRASFGSAIEVINLPGLTSITTDLELHRADPVELLRTMRRAEATSYLVGQNLADLEKDLEASCSE